MKKILWLSLIVLLSSIINSLNKTPEGMASPLTFSGGKEQDQAKVRQALPMAIGMVDETLHILEKGWENMTDAERQTYLTVFDPGNTGDIDSAFVQDSHKNFLRIREILTGGLDVIFFDIGGYCEGMRLFYTMFMNIYACSYLSVETNPERIARDLVHEVGHMAFLARDRAYFSESGSRYRALTPRGSAPVGLPILSYLLRELTLDDTLYHPDAYAHFAIRLTQMDTAGEVPEQVDRTPDPNLMAAAESNDAKLLSGLVPVDQE